MKRKSVITIAVSAALILSLAACGPADQAGQAPAESPASSEVSEDTGAPEPAEAPAETPTETPTEVPAETPAEADTAFMGKSSVSAVTAEPSVEASAEADTAETGTSAATAAPAEAPAEADTGSMSTAVPADAGADIVAPAGEAGEDAVAADTASAASSEAAGTDGTEMAAAAAEIAASDAEAFDTKMLSVQGLHIPVPAVYSDQLVIQKPEGRDDGTFLTVSEKASIDAASDDDGSNEGAGWLFSLAKISEETLRQLLCQDMSGMEVFAYDTDGNYYTYNHPTDVRYMRESVEQMTADQDKWSALCEWAGSVPERVVLQNPGLTPVKRTNTNLDIILARIAYAGDVKYTISTTAHGPMEPADVDPAPYLNRLVNGVTFQYAYDEEEPDGEYVVLDLPGEGVRYDFFLAEGKENYVREVHGEDYSILYKAVFEDGNSKASAIMNEWYEALVKKSGK